MGLDKITALSTIVLAVGAMATAAVAQIGPGPGAGYGDLPLLCPGPCTGSVNCNGRERAFWEHGACACIPK